MIRFSRQERQGVSCFFCLSLLCTISSVHCRVIGSEGGEVTVAIGTAVFVKRDSQEARTIYTNPRSSFLAIGSKYRDSGIMLKVPMRTLKFAGVCSDTKNDVASIVECTNAVRLNPDQFARDYPCSYDQFRAEVAGKSRKSLTTGPVVQRVAQLHTDDQARMNSMSHTGSDGSSLQTRADRASMPWGAVGENVAVGFSSAKAVVMAWMCSPPHRKNLMSCDFSQIGVGTSVSPSGRNFYTQVFMCDISESCSCSAGSTAHTQAPVTVPAVHSQPSHSPPSSVPVPGAHNPPHTASATASATAHGSHATATATAHAGGANHCAWVNGVWTCGTNVPPQHDVHEDEYHTKFQYSS